MDLGELHDQWSSGFITIIDFIFYFVKGITISFYDISIYESRTEKGE